MQLELLDLGLKRFLYEVKEKILNLMKNSQILNYLIEPDSQGGEGGGRGL